MDDVKKWYQSRSVWGGIVALVAAICGLLGIQIDAATHEALIVSLANGAAAIGAAVAIFGRLAAQKTLR